MNKETKLIISDNQATTIEHIRIRLADSIDVFRIINWLNNFKKAEWSKALEVLRSLKYYSNNHVIAEYNRNLEKLLAEIDPSKKIYVHGFGKLGKSGSTMLYFFRQTPVFKANENRFHILEHVVKLKRQNIKDGDILVLLDDIIGSGRSLSTFYRVNIKHQFIKEGFSLRIYALCVAYMIESVALLEKDIDGIQIIGTGYNKAFITPGSVFGYRPRMLPIREFCYEYGKPLFILHDYDKKADVPHPLGYDNSQSLIIFAHAVPNNTLPIIWSSKGKWFPLYPRSGQGKISEIKDFQQDNYYWLNLAYQLNILNKEQTGNSLYTNKVNFGLIAVIRLKKQNSGHQRIFQVLGVSANELDEIITSGREKGIFNAADELTAQGLSYYNRIARNIKIENTRIKRKKHIFTQSKMYIPKHFNGMT